MIDLLRAAFEVRAGLRLGGEQASALENDLGAELAPRQLGRIALGEHADAVAIDDHRVAVDAHFARKLAVRRVVTREVRIGLRIAQIIDAPRSEPVMCASPRRARAECYARCGRNR